MFLLALTHPLEDQFQSLGLQLLRFDQHLLPNADLAEIVEQAGIAQFPELAIREPQVAEGATGRGVDGFGKAHREGRHPARMARGHGVPLLDGRDRGVHEPLEEPLDVLPEPGVLDGHPRLPRQTLGQPHMLRLEGHGRLVLLIQPVDELKHTQHLAFGVHQGHGKHGNGAVAGLAVETVVESVGRGIRNAVDILDVERLADRSHIARHGGRADGHAETVVGQAHLGVLGVCEKQFLGARILHHQIDGTGLRSQEAPRLHQDHVQKPVEVVLRSQGTAHLMEPLHVPAIQKPPVARLHQGESPLQAGPGFAGDQVARPGKADHHVRRCRIHPGGGTVQLPAQAGFQAATVTGGEGNGEAHEGIRSEGRGSAKRGANP